jgi:hypothetical protein
MKRKLTRYLMVGTIVSAFSLLAPPSAMACPPLEPDYPYDIRPGELQECAQEKEREVEHEVEVTRNFTVETAESTRNFTEETAEFAVCTVKEAIRTERSAC